jgi:transposase InsO family protein
LHLREVVRVRVLRRPPQAPRANAICERLIGTLCRELLDRILIVNQAHLRSVLAEYALHYNAERPHQALANASRTMTPTRSPLSSAWIRRGFVEDRCSAASPASIR